MPIDDAARVQALSLVRRLESGELSARDFERFWPKRTKDLGVKSIGFWIWTLFSDDEEGTIHIEQNEEVLLILCNAVEFLSSSAEFRPRSTSPLTKIRNLLGAGVEWVDCELPWHKRWPLPKP